MTPFLVGCPWKDNCPDDLLIVRDTTIKDLLTITPLGDTFKIGDKVVVELTIPDSLYFDEEKISLYEKTGDVFPRLIAGSSLFFRQELNFSNGSQGKEENWFHLEYMPEESKFSLVINVTLIKPEQYRIPVWIFGTTFKGKEKCERYRVDTNIKGFEPGEFYEFVVIEN